MVVVVMGARAHSYSLLLLVLGNVDVVDTSTY